jgi:hypothetical protein
MNPMFCNFISLGLIVWLETNLQLNPLVAVVPPYACVSFSKEDHTRGWKRAKVIAHCIVGQNVFNHARVQLMGLLGSHSIQKLASTHGCKCGKSKDDNDI